MTYQRIMFALVLLALGLMTAYFVVLAVKPQQLHRSIQVQGADAQAEDEPIIYPLASCLEPEEPLAWSARIRTSRNVDPLVVRTVFAKGVDKPLWQVSSYMSLRDGGNVDSPLLLKLPTLEPGDYYLLVSISDSITRPARYRVPFRVSLDCGAG